MCATSVPRELAELLDASGDDAKEAGIEYAVKQSSDLLDHGAAGIHLYTFNQSNASVSIINQLRKLGFFPRKAAETQ
jgi:methylenetetrahydrofolate reductase (NADPH)